MNTNVNGGSAKIYQFPEGGRAALNSRRGHENAMANFASKVVGEATYGSWYHDEAIRESQQVKSVQTKPAQTKTSQFRPTIVPLTFPRQ